MEAYNVITKRRTIRKFKQDKIDKSILIKLIEAARQAPSGSNIQPVRYIVVNDNLKCRQVFKETKWAGYLKDGTPKKGEEPVAFIVVLVDSVIRKDGAKHDIGAAVQNIMLAAWDVGIGTCWMGAINRGNIKNILDIPEKYVIDTVVALGYAAEESYSEDENDGIKYYKDDKGVMHVPKIRQDKMVIKWY